MAVSIKISDVRNVRNRFKPNRFCVKRRICVCVLISNSAE